MLSQRKAGILLGYVNVIAKSLVNLVYTPLLLSFTGQDDYGVYQSCYSFVFSLTLLSFGFSQAYVRFYAQRKAGGSEEGIWRLNGVYLVLYSGISAFALILGLIFAANAEAVFSRGFTPAQVSTAQTVISVLSINIALALFNSIFDAQLVAREEFRFQQTRQLAITVATPFVAYALLLAGVGVVGVALAQTSVSAILVFLSGRYCIRHLGMRFEVRHLETGIIRPLAAFSAWIFANQVCDLVNQNVPNVLLGALSGASAVAVFSVSVQVRNVFMSLSTTMSNVFTPRIYRIVSESNDNAELSRLMTSVGRCQMILFCWLYGGFVLLGRFFIVVWAGPSFDEAYMLVLAMTLPLAVPLAQNTGIEIQRAKGMHRARSLAMLLVAFLNVVFTYIAAPVLDCWAAAWGYMVSIALCNGLFMNWYYQRRVGLDMGLFWRKNLPILLVGLATATVCFAGTVFYPVNGWVSFIVWGAAYSACYATALWCVVLDEAERGQVVALVIHSRW